MYSKKSKENKTSQRVISLSVVLCIVLSLIDLSFACDENLDSCCCSIESVVENVDDNCCESIDVSSCSLENSPCSCQSSSDSQVLSLPSHVMSEFDIGTLDTQYIYTDLPQLFDLHVEYIARGSPELYGSNSYISSFISLYWPTILLLC